MSSCRKPPAGTAIHVWTPLRIDPLWTDPPWADPLCADFTYGDDGGWEIKQNAIKMNSKW